MNESWRLLNRGFGHEMGIDCPCLVAGEQVKCDDCSHAGMVWTHSPNVARVRKAEGGHP